MAINGKCGETRNNAKNTVFKALQRIFTLGFKKWEAEGGKYYGEHFAPLNKGSQSLSRRTFYILEVTDAFQQFIQRLKKAEEWLEEEDIESVVYSRSLNFRERLEKSYEALLKTKSPIKEDFIDLGAFAEEDVKEMPKEGGVAV